MYLNKLCEYSEIICLNGTQNLTHLPTFHWKVNFLEGKKSKMNQNSYPIWNVHFGLFWKVTFTLKGLTSITSKKCVFNKWCHVTRIFVFKSMSLHKSNIYQSRTVRMQQSILESKIFKWKVKFEINFLKWKVV